MQCYKNAHEVNSVDILDRAFHYGDGCFTTARLYQGKIELENLHYARLNNAITALHLDVDLSLIAQTLQRIASTGEVNGTLKIIISRGTGQRGYAIPNHPADLFIFFYPQAQQEYVIKLIDSGVLNTRIGLTMPELVGLKSLNRLEQVMLKREAQQLNWVEALVCDVQGKVVEGVSSNCFIRILGRWITPELRYNGVHGVMRAEILSRMQHFGISCEQRSIDLAEIDQIESLFFCNALSPMQAVQSLHQRTLDVHPCLELFQTLQLNQMHEYVEA